MIPNSTALSNGAPYVEVYFAYDYASRRIGKTVVDKRVAPTVTKHISYAYDQWNPVAIWERAILVAPLVLKHTQLWGLDIGSSGTVDAGASASFQQAGGVGGLISSTHLTSNPITSNSYIPSFDANGNIIAWTAGDGTLLRKIDYDAFGNEVMVENYAAPATIAKLPEFGFSTKIKDAETGLSYYGYRYYDPKMGRWPSRGPIQEEGGVNLYGFVGNDSILNTDFIGLKTQKVYSYIIAGHGGKETVPNTVEDQMKAYRKESKWDEKWDRISAVSCFSNNINRRYENSIKSTSDRFDKPEIVDYADYYTIIGQSGVRVHNPAEPGYLWFRAPVEVDKNYKGPLKFIKFGNRKLTNTGEEMAYKAAEQKIGDAEQQAEADFEKFTSDPDAGKCTITVIVVCPVYTNVNLQALDFNDVPSGGRDRPCNYTNTYRYSTSIGTGAGWLRRKFNEKK